MTKPMDHDNAVAGTGEALARSCLQGDGVVRGHSHQRRGLDKGNAGGAAFPFQ